MTSEDYKANFVQNIFNPYKNNKRDGCGCDVCFKEDDESYDPKPLIETIYNSRVLVVSETKREHVISLLGKEFDCDGYVETSGVIKGIKLVFPEELEEVRLKIGGVVVARFDKSMEADLQELTIYTPMLSYNLAFIELVYKKECVGLEVNTPSVKFVMEDAYHYPPMKSRMVSIKEKVKLNDVYIKKLNENPRFTKVDDEVGFVTNELWFMYGLAGLRYTLFYNPETLVPY